VAVRAQSSNGSALSICADALLVRIDDLDEYALALVAEEAQRRPERWHRPVRLATESGSRAGRVKAGYILEQIGSLDDVAVLRALARDVRPRLSIPDLGRSLARRLATRVFVEDLGRVRILVGDSRIEGTSLRRKVLALLCLLITRPRFAATREEVIEILWPDFDPNVALNSLNQTVYFLRRVFEAEYSEALSPGYVEQDSETVWLDVELIDSRSARTRALLHGLPANPSAEQVWTLVGLYTDRFALDFAYEDWASEFRGALHAAYLRVVEGSIKSDLGAAHFERGIAVAERALEIEPESDDLQAALIRLYRLAGVHGAAAERYAQYRSLLGEIGVDVPRLVDV
jgi:DNA-binding SARP family transcriptional activator